MVDEVAYNQVHLVWTVNASSEQDEFTIEQSSDGENFTEVETVIGSSSTTVTIEELSPSTIYYFRVKAHNAIGDSGYSDVAQAETMPAAPADLAAISQSTNEIRLIWDAMPTLASDPTGNPDLTFTQSDGGTSLYILDESSTPLSSVVGYANSSVGNDYSIVADIMFENTVTELGLCAWRCAGRQRICPFP